MVCVGIHGLKWCRYIIILCYNEVVLKTNVRDCVAVCVFIGYKKRVGGS